MLGSAGGGQVGLGELVVGGGEADFESLGFAGPAFAHGFGDAVQEVVADFVESAALGGVDSQEEAPDAGVLVHLFWGPSLVPASNLKPGEHLKTPDDGASVTVVGGTIPKQHDGWMWDLTVPGNNDHDFYVVAGVAAAILVHNVDDPEDCAAAARYARDLLGRDLGNKHATYQGGYNSETGQVFTGCSSNPVGCAEDDLSRQGADTFTKAFGWRGGQWTEIETCLRCQESYSPNQFPEDIGAEPGGAWSDLENVAEDVADLDG